MNAESNPDKDTRFWPRISKVFGFELDVYEDIAASPDFFQAICVAAVAGTLSGSILTVTFFFIAIPLMLAGVGISAFSVRVVTKLLKGTSRPFGEWYRALAFATGPAALGIIPFVGQFAGSVYWVATQVAAVSRLADVSIPKAILIVLAAFLVPIVILVAFLATFGMLGGLLAALGALVGGAAPGA